MSRRDATLPRPPPLTGGQNSGGIFCLSIWFRASALKLSHSEECFPLWLTRILYATPEFVAAPGAAGCEEHLLSYHDGSGAGMRLTPLKKVHCRPTAQFCRSI